MTSRAFHLAHVPILVAGAAAVLFAGLVASWLVGPGDPNFRLSSLAVPGGSLAMGVTLIVLGLRHRSHPFLRTDAHAVTFGVLSIRSIARREIEEVVYDGRAIEFRLRQGEVRRYAPPGRGTRLAEIATYLNGWVRA